MSDVLNPVDIETAIRQASDRIHKGVVVVSNAEAKSRKAAHRLDVAVAHAYLNHPGPAHEKKYAAVIATQAERDAADDAELAYRHADRTAKAVEQELRALQSIGASVRAMYGAQQ